MIDVLIGGALAILGGLGGVLVQGRLDRKAEDRAQDRARVDRVREFRADSLRAAYRQLVVGAEHARAQRAGESPEQIAHLRTEIESAAHIGADPTLFGSEALPVLTGFADALLKLMEKAPGSGITRAELTDLAAWEARLSSCYLLAMKRILAEPGEP